MNSARQRAEQARKGRSSFLGENGQKVMGGVRFRKGSIANNSIVRKSVTD